MSIEYVNKTRALLTTALAILFVPGLSNAQLLSPSYTAEQAADGKAAYDMHCASCHGQALSDGEFGPPLTGSGFLQVWGGRTLDELFLETARTMPTAAPGSLSDQAYADILAYMLQHNGVSPDREALAADPQALSAVLLPSVGELPVRWACCRYGDTAATGIACRSAGDHHAGDGRDARRCTGR